MSALGTELPTRQDMVTVEEMPSSQWVERLSHIEPFKTHGFPNPELCKVLCAVTPTGEIAAAWWVTIAWHVEPLWIDEKHRHRPGLIRQLWARVRQELKGQGADVGFGIISDPLVAAQASRLGFHRVPGDLYFIRVDEENKES